MLFNSFHIAASHKNITKSFETAGAVFEPGIHGMPIVRFSIDFTTQIWHEHRTASEKAEIREKRKGKGQVETRIGIDDFNDISAYWENRNVEKAIEKMPKIIDYSESDPFHKLLCSFIPLDKNDIKELNPKIDIRRGRPKKDDTKKALKDKAKVCTYLTDYTFEQRLYLELESVGLDKK